MMRRSQRDSVAVHPVVRPPAHALLATLSVFVFLLAGPEPRATYGQVCGGDTVLVQFGSEMTYRSNSASDDDIILTQAGGSMKYLANTSDPGIGMSWTAEFFDDSSWSSGSYGVGYETAPPGAVNLIQTPVAAQSFSVFTRMTFDIPVAGSVNGLFLAADYDDGFAAWVNGVEVFRSTELPAGGLNWNTNAALHESSNGAVPNYGTIRDISFVIPYLHAGTNVIAVGVWNSAAATSSDLVLVPRVTMAPNWTLPDFPGGPTWVSGQYGVGYETMPPGASSLILTSVPAGTASIFTRATFEIPDRSAVTQLFLGADYDDGLVAYINGVEVFASSEVPFGPLAWNTTTEFHESSNATTPNYGTLQDISARGVPALRDGTNVLAVGIWNRMTPAESTDLVLVPRLAAGEDDACDGVDNDCDGIVDEDFPNFDGDAAKDCVDADDDNDGIVDDFDCAPFDVAVAGPPVSEVRNFDWFRSPVRTSLLGWQTQGTGVVYDLAGGAISALRIDGGVSGAACLPGADNVSDSLYDDTRPAPPAGDGYYYIVRSQKPPACGTGTYGLATSGAERLPTSDCP